MSYLRENESSINFLHRELRTLSRLLVDAKSVVEETPYLLDVEEYLKKADVSWDTYIQMHACIIHIQTIHMCIHTIHNILNIILTSVT